MTEKIEKSATFDGTMPDQRQPAGTKWYCECGYEVEFGCQCPRCGSEFDRAYLAPGCEPVRGVAVPTEREEANSRSETSVQYWVCDCNKIVWTPACVCGIEWDKSRELRTVRPVNSSPKELPKYECVKCGKSTGSWRYALCLVCGEDSSLCRYCGKPCEDRDGVWRCIGCDGHWTVAPGKTPSPKTLSPLFEGATKSERKLGNSSCPVCNRRLYEDETGCFCSYGDKPCQNTEPTKD